MICIKTEIPQEICDIDDEDKALKFSYCCLKTESIVSFKNSALLSEYVRTLSTGFCLLLFESILFNTMKHSFIKRPVS